MQGQADAEPVKVLDHHQQRLEGGAVPTTHGVFLFCKCQNILLSKGKGALRMLFVTFDTMVLFLDSIPVHTDASKST